jgi:hypothetical protein
MLGAKTLRDQKEQGACRKPCRKSADFGSMQMAQGLDLVVARGKAAEAELCSPQSGLYASEAYKTKNKFV